MYKNINKFLFLIVQIIQDLRRIFFWIHPSKLKKLLCFFNPFLHILSVEEKAVIAEGEGFRNFIGKQTWKPIYLRLYANYSISFKIGRKHKQIHRTIISFYIESFS